MDEAGESPSTLAAEIGVSHTSVARWLEGSEPRAAALKKLAAFFSVSPPWLLGLDKVGEKESVYQVRSRAHSAGLEERIDDICNAVRVTLYQFPSTSPKLRAKYLELLSEQFDEFGDWCDSLKQPAQNDP